MKSSSSLIGSLRVIFGFGRGIALFLMVISPVLTFFSVGKTPLDIGEVYFRIPTVQIHEATTSTRPAILKNLHGDLHLPALNADEIALQRYLVLLPDLMMLVLVFFGLHWLWQICRNVERGEVFTPLNLKLIQRLGALFIAEALLTFAVKASTAAMITRYVKERIVVTGLEVIAPPSGFSAFVTPGPYYLDVDQIVTGMVILCLAQVFRQGLQLKREAELTV